MQPGDVGNLRTRKKRDGFAGALLALIVCHGAVFFTIKLVESGLIDLKKFLSLIIMAT